MEDGSPSRSSWADEADEELPSPRSLGAGSPGLSLHAFLGSPSSSREDRIVFSDPRGTMSRNPQPRSRMGRGRPSESMAGAVVADVNTIIDMAVPRASWLRRDAPIRTTHPFWTRTTHNVVPPQ